MTLLEPWALLWLSLLPVLLMRPWRRRPRRPLRVSSLALWTQEPRSSRSLWWRRRLRRNRLLILQIAIFSLVVLALARPVVNRGAPGGRSIVLLIDASGSMNALENGVSRLALAKRRALALVDRLDRADRVRVAVAKRGLEYETPMSSSRAVVRDAIERITPSHAEVELAHLVGELLANAANGIDQVVVLSDGAGETSPPPDTHPAGLRMIQVGRSDNNLAISRMSSRADPLSPFDEQILTEVSNFSRRRQKAALTLRQDETTLLTERLTLEADEQRMLFAETTAFEKGLVTATLDVADDLAYDNRALGLVGASRALSVLVITDGNPYLRKALEVDPLCEVTLAHPAAASLGDLDRFDLVVLDRVKAPTVDHKRLLEVLPTAGEPGSSGERPLAGRLRVSDPSHPLAVIAGLEGLWVERAAAIPLQAGSVGFLTIAGQPVAASRAADGARRVVLGFDVRAGELPLSPSFPILMAKIVRWLEPSGASDSRFRVGQPLAGRLAAAADLTAVRVRDPLGLAHSVPVREGQFTFGDTDLSGLYTVSGLGPDRHFVVDAFSDRESNIAPGAGWESDRGRRARPAVGSPTLGLARPLLALAVALLLGEWLLAFPRRAPRPAPRRAADAGRSFR